MDVAVISMESIKPFSPVDHLKPFKLCLLDQLTPTTYSPLIFFYTMNDIAHSKARQISAQLKWSLSKTLTLYHPLSGRVENNLIIHNFEEGVPYIEARVKGCLSDFLQHPEMHLLNRFLPCQPFCQQPDPRLAPVAVQVTLFDCGGIALGMCFSHKINDGITASSFMKSWAAYSRGSSNGVVHPNLTEASLLFPPQETLSPSYTSMMESLWFSKGKFSTRRFVFNADAVASLISQGISERIQNPTRVEALCAFIWKSAMKACRSVSGSSRPSVLSQAVNIRRRTKPRLSRYSIGNLVWSTIDRYNPEETNTDMQALVALLRDGVATINSEYLKSISGDQGCFAIFEHLNEFTEISNENPDVFSFFSWHTFDFGGIDFGWGKPIWVGIFGEASRTTPSDSNCIILKDNGNGRNNAIEAWMTLDESTMTVLEHDSEFLAYAALNPSIVMGSS